METARLETFADGVFAIAATLLIIDVHADAEGGRLAHALLHAWPQYAAYAVSFLTIGVVWVNHHTVLRQIGLADRTFLFLNVLLLMDVAFVPFPTRLAAEHFNDAGARAAAVTYGVTMTLMAMLWAAVWFYAAIGRRLIDPKADQRVVSGISRSYVPGTAMYGLATVVAVWSPDTALVLYGAIAVFYVLESSIFGRG